MQKYFIYAAVVMMAQICVSAQAEEITLGPAAPGGAAPAIDPATYRQQVSYVLGRNIGNDLVNNGIEVDLASLSGGISDALSGKESKWSQDELDTAMMVFEQQMTQIAIMRLQQQAEQNQREGDAFFAKNKDVEGVQVTESGLQYLVIEEGEGPSPTVDDTVKCHYRGMLLDGTEFDTTYDEGEPVDFQLHGIIPAWIEALQKMRVGSKWKLFVPSDLGFGLQTPGPPIEPNSALIFELELVEIVEE